MTRFALRLVLCALPAAALAGPASGSAEPAGAQRGSEMSEALAIDEGQFVDINGMPQWVAVRGRDRDNPVLLYLHGGPGFPTSQWAPVFAPWEEHFTVVHWDQPGGGATWQKNGAEGQGPLTIDRYIKDGLAVAEWTRAYLGARKIIVMGASWGTILGLELVRARPELFSAYVGTAQVATVFDDPRTYEIVLKEAQDRGDAAAVAALANAKPPYTSFEAWITRQQYANVPAPRETEARAAIMPLYAPAPPDARYVPHLPPHDFFAVFMATQRAMFEEMRAYDIRKKNRSFEVPIFIFQGDSDLNTPAPIAAAYFDTIEAPQKFMTLIPGIGHDTSVVPAELLTLLNTHVRPVAVAAQ